MHWFHVIFAKKMVKVNFCNFHTVLHQPQPKCNFFFLTKKDFSCIYLPLACINKLLWINWDTSKSQNHANKNKYKFVKWNVKFSELVTHSVEKWEIHFYQKIFREMNSFLTSSCMLWKFRDFSSLRFYVKSILENLHRRSKNAIFAIFGAMNLANLVNSSLQRVQKFRVWKRVLTMINFVLLESSKLISRKIWVMGKLWNFHTV